MATRNQIFFLTADWDLLRKYKGNPEKYPQGVPLDHRYFEDLRRYAWWLGKFPYGGLYDETQFMWNDGFVPVYNPSYPPEGVLAYAGDVLFTTFDISHGMGQPSFNAEGEVIGWSGKWIWWTINPPLGIELRKENYNTNIAPMEVLRPPTSVWNAEHERWESKIHPDTWIDGHVYSANQTCSYLGSWKAKRTTQNPNLSPDKNSADWESYPDWITANNYWKLVDSPNEYHTVDKGAIHSRLRSLVVRENPEGDESIGSIIVLSCKIDKPPYAYYPPQADPKAQYKPLIYITQKQEEAFQYRHKVAFKQNFITNPSRLGPMCDWIDRMGYRDQRVTKPTAPFQMVRRDANGVLAQFNGDRHTESCAGDQYANDGFDWWNNTCGIVDGANEEWTSNPKIVYDFENDDYPCLQAFLEVLLSRGFTFQMDNIWKSNYGNEPEDGWESLSLPSGNSELFGENESNFEYTLKMSGSYDWYFDMVHPYAPSSAIENAVAQCVAPYIPSMAQYLSPEKLIEGWKLNPLGTWRRTWKHTLGRLSPWIRSQEMGVPPNRHETWNPSFNICLNPEAPPAERVYYTYPCVANHSSYCVGSAQNSGINYDSDAKWFGARTDTMPLVTHFDNIYKSITALKLEAIQWVSGGTYYQNDYCSDDGDIYYAKQDIENKNISPSNNSDEWANVTNYTFAVDGNITDKDAESGEYLREGWQIHLAPSVAAKIDVCNPAYVLSCSYNDTLEKTIVMMSEAVPNPTGYIYWNRRVCQRHDGISASWKIDNETGQLSYTINYWPTVDMLLSMLNVQQTIRYRSLSMSWSSRAYFISSLVNVDNYSTECDHKDLMNLEGAINFALGKMAQYHRFDDEAIENYYSDQFYDWVFDEHQTPDCPYWDVMVMWESAYLGTTSKHHISRSGTGYEYYDGTHNSYHCQASFYYRGFALKAQWPEKLKELPKTVIVKLRTWQSPKWNMDLPQYENYTGFGKCLFFDQKSKVAGDYQISSRYSYEQDPWTDFAEPQIHRIPLATNGKWYLSMPQVNDYFISTYKFLEGENKDSSLYSNGFISLDLDVNNLDAAIPIDGDDAKMPIWTRDMTGHIDCLPLGQDNNAPNPNAPVWWYKPYGEIRFVNEYGKYGEENHAHPKFEIYVCGKICLSEDLEGTQVWYRMTCVNHAELDTQWTTGLTHETKLLDVVMPEEILSNNEYVIGQNTLELCGVTGDYSVGNTVLISNQRIVFTVQSYSEGVLVLKFDFWRYNPPQFNNPISAVIYNVSKAYVVVNEEEIICNSDNWSYLTSWYLFQPQTKDSAFPFPNESLKGPAEYPREPDKFQADVVKDALENV